MGMKRWVNNVFLAGDAPCLHADDRGFRYGDGLFETLAVTDGVPYLWEYHRERLDEGLKALRITADTARLRDNALTLLAENRVRDGILRIAISRGRGGRGYLPAEDTVPTVVIETMPPPPPVSALTLHLSAVRRLSPRALPTHIKLAQGVNATLARLEARDHGCDDALLLGEDGALAEASGASLFWLKNGALFTPALSTGALDGTTRRRLREKGPYPVQEGHYGPDALKSAEAVFLAGAVTGILRVRALKPLGLSWPETEDYARLVAWREADKGHYRDRFQTMLAT